MREALEQNSLNKGRHWRTIANVFLFVQVNKHCLLVWTKELDDILEN